MKKGRAGILRNKWFTYLMLLAFLLVLFVLFGSFFYNQAMKKLYQESVSQLDEISSQLFEKLDVQIELQWDYLYKVEEKCSLAENLTEQELADLLAHYETDLCPGEKTMYFRAIDSDGHYYSSNGQQGMWTGIDKLTEKRHQSFLIANWLDNENYMAFTCRVENHISVDGNEITHFVLLRSMKDMQPFFHSSTFDNRNIAYIVDVDGFILARDGNLSGIEFEGKNAFRNMEKQVYPHMNSFEDIRVKGHSQAVCTDVIIGGNTYYLVYDELPDYDWGVLLLVSSDDVAESAKDMVDSLMLLFFAFTVVVISIVTVTLLIVSRFNNARELLKVKTKNESLLSESNLLLEEINQSLKESQHETAEALAVAEKATKAKSQFLANMSHDIRTPMNAIVGVSKLMEHDVNNPEKLRYYIRKIQNSGQHMIGLINDILDMSKIESGEVYLNLEPVRMAEQVGQIESIIRSQVNERGQSFTVSVHNLSHEYLIGDSIRIRQVFLNLLSNAVKYTPYGGSIQFELTELPCDIPDHAAIFSSVIDNGYGMSEEFLEHIFEPFTRAEDSTTNKIQGTGLGMSITKSIIDMMGGSISVQSELGKGSRFDVLLTVPIDKDAISDMSIGEVLLISDDDAFAENVSTSLEDKPARLRTASDVDSAVSMMDIKQADIILLSGSICNEMLADTVSILRDKSKNEILIFCCDYTYHEHVRDMIVGSGVDGLIARPFFFENLLLAIKHVHDMLSPAEGGGYSPLKGMHFLCAEDNDLNAEILEALLDMHNATCKIYPSGLELVEAFDSVKPGDYDAILMDVQMPKMNGIDATRAIRHSSNPLGKSILIIAMTANAFSSDVQECLDAGMNAHLAKPLDISELERTLHELMSENGGG